MKLSKFEKLEIVKQSIIKVQGTEELYETYVKAIRRLDIESSDLKQHFINMIEQIQQEK